MCLVHARARRCGRTSILPCTSYRSSITCIAASTGASRATRKSTPSTRCDLGALISAWSRVDLGFGLVAVSRYRGVIAAPPIRRRWARTSRRGDRARRLGGPTATCAPSRSIALLRSTFAPARNRASWTTSPTPGINAPAPGRGYRSSTGSPSRSRTTAMPPRPQQQQERRTPRPTMGRGAVVQDGTARAGTRTSPREGTRYSRPQGGTAFPSRTDVRTICEAKYYCEPRN